jgi:hypothetical protein
VARDPDESEAEQLADRSAPLISKPASDLLVKILLSAMVALLAFLLGFAYDGNREIGELASELRNNTLATDRRITALETATERRLTVLENRVERIQEGSR